MNRRLFSIVLLAAPVFAADEALPSGESILDRFVEVTGGKEAYAKHTTEIQTGVLEYPALGVKASVVRYSAEPDKYLLTMDMPGVGKVDTGVINGVAWSNSAIAGPRIMSGEERALAVREATFNGTLNWRKNTNKADNTGIESIDGEDCYKVIITPKEGRPETRYFSKKSGLLVKASTVAATQMGDVPVEMRYSGYKDFGGLRYPATVSQKAAGQEFTVTIQSVKLDEAIPAERFALPAEIKALADKKP
jgi:hypothetical protein